MVYPKVAAEAENAGMVTGYTVRPGGQLVYLLSGADGEERSAYEFELTDEVDYRAAGNGRGDEET